MERCQVRGYRAIWMVLGLLLSPAIVRGQGPTIETPIAPEMRAPTPGSSESLLGPRPGGEDLNLGTQPGRDELLMGRIGTAAPRAPASISRPGEDGQPRRPRGVAAPEALPIPRAPLFGTLALPAEAEDEGPADGLSLDQAIDLLIRNNLELRSKFMEIPQARADVLTASLRANPVLYADSQLIPYGSYSPKRPGGPTQYDVNISYPLDYSRKRLARTEYACRALKVTEAQYQDAVRMEIDRLYAAFVDVLAARQTLRFSSASAKGLERLQQVTELLYKKDIGSRADVNEVKSQRQIAELGVLDAEENVRRAKRVLAQHLYLPPEQAESLEVRGTIDDRAPPPPPAEELARMALSSRPDILSYRLGLQTAESGVRLAMANRYQDAYLLYQPYTYQENAPFGRQSATSWALGITFPLPIYNRNQGNIERARLNVGQAQLELAAIERRILTEVKQAAREYEVTRQIVERIRTEVMPSSETFMNDRLMLYRSGEPNVVTFLQAQRTYNENVKSYRDTAVRHRRSMLSLNTALGQRILP